MITQDDILTQLSDESTLIELTDLENSGIVDSTIVDRAIATSSGIVEAYIVLSDPISQVQRSVLTDLAIYYLFAWAAKRSGTELSESVRDSYKQAIALLKQLQNKALVGDPTVPPAEDAGAIWSAADPIFYPEGDGCGETF